MRALPRSDGTERRLIQIIATGFAAGPKWETGSQTMVQTMLRLFGIILLAVAMAFAFGANAQVAHACPFGEAVAMGHAAPHSMAGQPIAHLASPAQDHSQPPSPCKHSCPPVTFVIALDPLALPEPSAVTLNRPRADSAFSLTLAPSERPPKSLL